MSHVDPRGPRERGSCRRAAAAWASRGATLPPRPAGGCPRQGRWQSGKPRGTQPPEPAPRPEPTLHPVTGSSRRGAGGVQQPGRPHGEEAAHLPGCRSLSFPTADLTRRLRAWASNRSLFTRTDGRPDGRASSKQSTAAVAATWPEASPNLRDTKTRLSQLSLPPATAPGSTSCLRVSGAVLGLRVSPGGPPHSVPVNDCHLLAVYRRETRAQSRPARQPQTPRLGG